MGALDFYINVNKLVTLTILCLFLFSLSACGKQEQTDETQNTNPAVITATPVQKQEHTDQNIIIENKSYLFNVKEHSLSELEALLERAEEVTINQSPEYKDLEIVMVIHGPDIEWFTQQKYTANKKLLDLAARLDEHNIIDMKVCEKSMKYHGIDRKDIPKFIDSVPYAPIEIENRLRDGYINL